MDKVCDFRQQLLNLTPWQQRLVLPVLDAARHLLGGYQRNGRPFDIPDLNLLDRPDLIYTSELFPRLVELMNLLFPQMQFFVTVTEEACRLFPHGLLIKTHEIPALPDHSEKKSTRLPPGDVLLVDVDSMLPKLALLKFSQAFKKQGESVFLGQNQDFMPGIEFVHTSGIFPAPTATPC